MSLEPSRHQDSAVEFVGRNVEGKPLWIWPELGLDEENGQNQILDFWQSFEVTDLGDSPSLLISADTDFVVWINGNMIGHGQFPNFPESKTYEEFPLDKFLIKGTNTIAITVYYNGVNCSVYLKGKPGLIFGLQGAKTGSASGTSTLWRKNPSYHNGPIVKVSGQLSHTFAYDARHHDHFGNSSFHPGHEWKNIQREECSLPEKRISLTERPIARLISTGYIEGKLIEEGVFKYHLDKVEKHFEASIEKNELDGLHLSNGKVVPPGWLMQNAERSVSNQDSSTGLYLLYDLGREEAGHLSFEVNAPEGTIVDISYGEHLDDGHVRAAIGSRCFGSRYICKEGIQNFYHPFLRWAGRYLQVYIHSESGSLSSIGLNPLDYAVDGHPFPEGLSQPQKEILQTGYRTLQLCMHDHYEDTPWREQALYANDARTQALCGYYAFGEFKMPAASFALLGQGLRDDGLLNLTAPAKPPPTIPSFTLVWMLAIRDHFLYSGDPSLAKALLPQIRSMLRIFISEMENGLLPLRQEKGVWHFYDWSADMSGYDNDEFSKGLKADAPLNCFFILALEATREIMTWLELPEDQTLIDAETSAREAVLRDFWDPELGMLRTHHLTDKVAELTQSLAVLAKIGDEEMRTELLQKISNPNSGLAEAGLSQTLYIFKALLSAGETHHPYILDRIDRTWGEMLNSGATSFWETNLGASDFSNAGSLCHGWSAVPVYVLFRIFSDLLPEKPGDFSKNH